MDFQKAILAGGKYGGIFSRNFGEGLRGFPKCNIRGRKRWENFSRKLERVCVDFQKAVLAGGKDGGIFPEILSRFVSISQKQYWWEETMGDFL